MNGICFDGSTILAHMAERADMTTDELASILEGYIQEGLVSENAKYWSRFARNTVDSLTTVRLIYKMYLNGKTITAIARYLTAQGVPTPAGMVEMPLLRAFFVENVYSVLLH